MAPAAQGSGTDEHPQNHPHNKPHANTHTNTHNPTSSSNNRPSSTDPTRHQQVSQDPNAPPTVPAKVLTKNRPDQPPTSGSSSRSSAGGSAPRSDPDSPKNDYVVVDNPDSVDPERLAGTRSRSQSFSSGGQTIRHVGSSSSNTPQPDVPTMARPLADNTMQSAVYAVDANGRPLPRKSTAAGEGGSMPGGNADQPPPKHPQHGPHAPATVGVSDVNVNVHPGGVTHENHMAIPMPHNQTIPVQDGGQGPGGGGGLGLAGMVKSYLGSGTTSPTPRDKEVDRLRTELKKRDAQAERDRREIRRLQTDMRTHITTANVLQQERQKLSEMNNSMHYELIHVKKQLEEVTALADIRGKELLGAQKFLTKADSISISDLKERVVALNDEIFQAAASLGETIVHQTHELTSDDVNRIYSEVVHLLGEPISNLLVEEGRKPDAEADPLLVQVVLQVFMTKVCASKIELWVPNDPKISDFFTAVYMNIQATEEPAVSGRWRALTQAHTRPITSAWREDLISSLMKIFKLAAWRTPDKDQRLSFESKLVPIFKAVADLRIAMGEKITSADIHLSLVPHSSIFAGEWMDDAFADSRAKAAIATATAGGPPQCVIGTTGFGLKKVIVGQRGPQGELLYESVTSPKVILESTLKETLNPPPRSKPGARKPAGSTPMGGPRISGSSTSRNRKEGETQPVNEGEPK